MELPWVKAGDRGMHSQERLPPVCQLYMFQSFACVCILEDAA